MEKNDWKFLFMIMLKNNIKDPIIFSRPIINADELNSVNLVLKSGIIAQGKKTIEFEEQFAKYCGTKYAVAVNSGTAALHCSLYAIGVKENDEIITTPFTFVATANTILMQKAKVVFVDISEEDFNINPNKIIEKITDKTKAILPVDIFGHIFDYEKIKKFTKKFNLKIIEDACQAIGSKFRSKKAGSFGDLGCFSFYATKNMTTGEGGMIVTNNKKYAELCRSFRHHGQSIESYQYNDIGYNYRMTDIAAAIGLVQLKKVDNFNFIRIRNAEMLTEGLLNLEGIVIPKLKSNDYISNFHQYTIRVTKEFKMTRDQLKDYLKRKNVPTAIFYPFPLHLTTHFLKQGYKIGDFPIAEKISQEVLSLPINPLVSEKNIKYIIDTIRGI
ncbi:MAG: DegT/DnrJ/EryC1/StrS family aminotransferase [Cyanobacteria bacterium]|nr:DegT/DnrJ/EryC1/StrS family aminotransferase [Cyanobacteriota bacterium]